MYNLKYHLKSVISGFHCEVDENCAGQGYYAANSGNFLLTFRDNLSASWSERFFPKRRHEITSTRCVITQEITDLFLPFKNFTFYHTVYLGRRVPCCYQN